MKGNGHDRCPGYRTCHCCDGNTGNNDGSGAWLKAGTALVRWRNCPRRNGLDGGSATIDACVTGDRASLRDEDTGAAGRHGINS